MMLFGPSLLCFFMCVTFFSMFGMVFLSESILIDSFRLPVPSLLFSFSGFPGVSGVQQVASFYVRSLRVSTPKEQNN